MKSGLSLTDHTHKPKKLKLEQREGFRFFFLVFAWEGAWRHVQMGVADRVE